ncbi:MAG: alpha-glucosidase [Leptospiraceae bacterium]|nr:alpha-glucosidase [Leptospiraceae bacterium]
MKQSMKWWQTTTIYQIYPRSFLDTNNDGIGDLKGIISKLNYIKDLGFETIWISPFYKSPGKDFHYDISDYTQIDPIFGTIDDVDVLIKEIHNRKMRIVFDMVLNHTSNEHPWFQESRSSIDNPKRDWYLWKKGNEKGKPPNNWMSMINKPGWNYDAQTDEWYFANFLDFQPDLNYRNPEVKKAMFAIMRFWLDKGVDGFRLDIFNSIFKDSEFRDNPFSLRFIPTPDSQDEAFFQKKIHTLNHPDCFGLAKEIHSLLNEYQNDRFLLGEVSGNDTTLKKFLGEKNDGLHLVFQFELIHFQFSAKFFRDLLSKNEAIYPYPFTPTYVYGNHDQMRYIEKVDRNPAKAKLLALFQFTARGIPVVYYGEEIGMQDTDIPNWAGKDPIAQQNAFFPKFLANAIGVYMNRDNCRTPMQWNSTETAGFTSATTKPWIAVSKCYSEFNVETESLDENSLLNTYKRLLKLRNENPAFQMGSLEIIADYNKYPNLLVFRRFTQDKSFEVFLNFGSESLEITISDIKKCIFSLTGAVIKLDSKLELAAYSGIVLEI